MKHRTHSHCWTKLTPEQEMKQAQQMAREAVARYTPDVHADEKPTTARKPPATLPAGMKAELQETVPCDYMGINKEPRLLFERVVADDGHTDSERKQLRVLRQRGIDVGHIKGDVLAPALGTTRRGVPPDYTGDNPNLCNARTRSGRPCRAMKVPGRKRCKWHGGLSTGPRTPEGKAKVRRNLQRKDAGRS